MPGARVRLLRGSQSGRECSLPSVKCITTAVLGNNTFGLMNAYSRRRAALEAIGQVAAGATAADVETELVDFKVEVGTVRGDRRYPISATHEPAAVALRVRLPAWPTASVGA